MSDLSNRSEPQNPIDPAAAAIIRRKAARMVGRAGLRPQDRPDLEQELTLHVLQRRDRFNRRRGSWPAFVGRIVERYGENLVRARLRAWRAVGPFGPLPDDVPDPAPR